MLRFVVALQAEARPLVARFAMAVVSEGPFPVYRGEEGWLIVSGQGKAASAAATAYLHLIAGGAQGRAWLNVGLGGHCQRTLGEGVLAHKISDAASGASWYPQLVIDAPSPTVPVLSVERMEEEYALPWVYESEAAGFFPTACRFSVAELVHCYKVISDNPDATLSRRMPSLVVEDLIAANGDRIEAFARGLVELAGELEAVAADPPGYYAALGRWSFTAAQERRLRRLLQRLAALDPESSRDPTYLEALFAGARAEREVLRSLEARLAAIPIRLPPPGAAADDLR
jgi:adenosylhomocysteine nucleosidase